MRYGYMYTTAALKGIHDLENQLRNTGRTNQAVETLRDGDVYIVTHPCMAAGVNDAIGRLGVKAVAVATSPEQKINELIYFRGREITGKIVFDHHWAFENFQWRLNKAMLDMVVETNMLETTCIRREKNESE